MSQPRHLFLFLIPLLPAALCLQAGEKIEAGQEGKLEIPGNQHASVIYIPKDYKEGMKLPLIFFMHGAGGSPTSWPFKTATKGEGYIIVGLAYGAQDDAGKGGIHEDTKTCEAMLEYVNQARDAVKAAYGLNEKQVFLTGLSMGGWGVNFYGFQKKAKGLFRGYCIIAAGPVKNPGVDLSVASGLPVLLLNGEKDPNLKAANEGKPALEKAGAIVKQIVLPGQGHVPGTDTMDAPLLAWLRENGPLQEVLALLEKAKAAEKESLGNALALYQNAFDTAGASTDSQLKEPREHYQALAAAAKAEWDAAVALADQKKYAACVEALRKLASTYKGCDTARNAEKKIQEISSNGEIQKTLTQEKTALAAEQALSRALEKLKAKDYSSAAEMLKQVSTQYPDTPASAKAAEQLKALADDPKISAAIEATTSGKECRGLLSSANNYHQNGMEDKAQECLNQIIKKYPKSTWAAEAQKLKGEWGGG